LSTPFRLQVPRRIHEEMLAQATGELPNECCGILAGILPVALRAEQTGTVAVPVEPPIVRVERRYPLVNAAQSPKEYLSDPHSMLAAVRDMRQHGLEILGVFHSHPTSAPIPSKTDLERNYSEEVVHFIISLEANRSVTRAWWLTANGFREAAWEIVED
jgi:proteasome lid subunit RPN8/RPN11